MARATATAVRVTGTCNAGYTAGQKIVVNLDTACIDKEQSAQLCLWALGAILANLSRLGPGETCLASCPDPATGLGGNVVFELVREAPRG